MLETLIIITFDVTYTGNKECKTSKRSAIIMMITPTNTFFAEWIPVTVYYAIRCPDDKNVIVFYATRQVSIWHWMIS